MRSTNPTGPSSLPIVPYGPTAGTSYWPANFMASEMDIALEGIGKRYGNDLALKPLDLQVPPGVLLALLGPSGCGKTTLLRLIAGLIEPSQGKIEIRGRDVTHVPAHRRNLQVE